MAFNIGLSGIRAAGNELEVTGNNIANASTIGFKSSRAEFADVYAASTLGTSANATGSGVLLSNIGQQFTQGSINFTSNSLDMAINGDGFFVLDNNGETTYSRAGYFGTDKEGFIVNNFGKNLQGYGADATGQILTGVLTDLQVDTTNQSPQATGTVNQTVNLNSSDLVPLIAPFDPTDPDTYNSATSVNVYDSLGNSHIQTQYFVKTGANTWDMHVLIDGRDFDGTLPDGTPPPDNPAANVFTPFTQALTFDSAGQLTAPAPGTPVVLAGWEPRDSSGSQNGAASPSGYNLDMTGSTQFSSSFAVTSVNQDGFSTGQLAGLEVSDEGVLFARYTNGQSRVQGQVVFANFANTEGLSPLGKTEWAESFDSGNPVVGTPRSGTLGALQAGALESSNVELSDELVNLIIAQRNYQANAKTIETSDAVTQTILNI
ncbi:flagellar hook protein FlgE [Aestuariirhabdus litorea]|uniref:Flagellar hook protein FlgE n=1 Tax=Aestuariirhabdus litorea TaxID=2528527 RepID=A0A3P3VQE8_9GAMM|nr:flagellar hook protein FlgE [Aestuariirhabdus litorea]RRJ85011.1 flagellar hook protein FlgE [Aestuariirhabdus litorea]RWW98236.1 flagellar hook-basal body complex protein [Endozoicomonadaceae bacterium GTF-13]